MNITKVKVKCDFTIFDRLFLNGDIIYISGSIYTMDGRFDYARKYFSEDRTYLGRTSDDYYYKNIQHKVSTHTE